MNKTGIWIWRIFLFFCTFILASIAYRTHTQETPYEVWQFLVWGFFAGLVGLLIKIEFAPARYERLRAIKAMGRGAGSGLGG